MIPKKIHYCWFGQNPLPTSARKCINSWKRFFPDFEIIEWNESNYNVQKISYISQAYNARKYAFVSDYARFDILYHEGGIYFDTDVEVIKSFEDILKNGAFMGCETDGLDLSDQICKENEFIISVNPGLGIAAAPGLSLYKQILDFYSTEEFLKKDGSLNTETVVEKTTQMLKKCGLQNIKGIQHVADVTIYPKEYFNPMNNNTGKIEKTNSTCSIHRYSMSWLSAKERIRSKITRPIHRIFGEDIFVKLGLKK